ncbi:hypothetical protein [Cellulosimicrobium cellulans]|uniref:hypothetical protein n=1 Tax=Cellulosimicrobium cellulans TaxID=1710 RepID=UPI00130DF36B|nr:hypothetical protein [Cellulosimicrobium cellulans]
MPVTGGHPTDPATGGATAPAPQPGVLATAPARHDEDSRRTAAPGTIPTQRALRAAPPAALPTAPPAAPPAALPVALPTAPPAAPPPAPPATRAPFTLDAPTRPARRRRAGRGRAVATTVLCAALVGAVAAGVVVQLRADARATAWAHAQQRVAAAYAAQRVDEAFVADARAARAAGRYDALVAGAVRDAGTVVTAARAAADASPHAGDAPLAALRAAADAAQRAADGAGSGVSPATVAAAVAAVAAPQRAVVDAEAAWQAAEAARIAAERAAAERAAAEAAQRAAAQRSTSPRTATGARSNRAAAPAASGGGAAAPAAPAAAWAPGVASYGVGGLGAALNAARAENGLPALSVSGSSSLADHAAAMAAAGSIWHSGSDHIVGWVQPVSDSQMIAAYMNSPGHRAWILKADKSSVSIGAVTINGRLYTAMRFS